MDEKVYLENSAVRITDAYVSVRGKRIVPLEKIARTAIVKRSTTEKCALSGAVLFLILFFHEGFSLICLGFFILFAAWLGRVWRRFASLWCVVEKDVAVRLAVASRRRLGELYDVQDALETALDDFRMKPDRNPEEKENLRRKLREELGENFREG